MMKRANDDDGVEEGKKQRTSTKDEDEKVDCSMTLRLLSSSLAFISHSCRSRGGEAGWKPFVHFESPLNFIDYTAASASE